MKTEPKTGGKERGARVVGRNEQFAATRSPQRRQPKGTPRAKKEPHRTGRAISVLGHPCSYRLVGSLICSKDPTRGKEREKAAGWEGEKRKPRKKKKFLFTRGRAFFNRFECFVVFNKKKAGFLFLCSPPPQRKCFYLTALPQRYASV